VNRSLPIEHVMRANIERRVVSQRRKAGRRLVSAAPRVIVGQLENWAPRSQGILLTLFEFALYAN
jgi:hypothetical protein